jgi:hypothetical protein
MGCFFKQKKNIYFVRHEKFHFAKRVKLIILQALSFLFWNLDLSDLSSQAPKNAFELNTGAWLNRLDKKIPKNAKKTLYVHNFRILLTYNHISRRSKPKRIDGRIPANRSDVAICGHKQRECRSRLAKNHRQPEVNFWYVCFG